MLLSRTLNHLTRQPTGYDEYVRRDLRIQITSRLEELVEILETMPLEQSVEPSAVAVAADIRAALSANPNDELQVLRLRIIKLLDRLPSG